MERIYYKIREVSDMLGIPASKLRYWEKVIPQLSPYKHTGKTRRFYTPEDVELLKRIKFLREEQNLPISVVISTLSQDSAPLDSRMQAIDLLKQLKQELTSLRNMI